MSRNSVNNFDIDQKCYIVKVSQEQKEIVALKAHPAQLHWLQMEVVHQR